MKPLGTHSDFLDLAKDYELIVSATKLRNWRLLFPNVGQLDGFPHFGSVFICATDGIEAFYQVDESGTLWKGHLRAFNGPLSKTYVWDDDWDFERRKHKVKIFRRRDGSLVIIPTDHIMDDYWSRHERMSQDEFNVYAECGYGRLKPSEIDGQLELLHKQRVEVLPTKRPPSKRQQLLATL